MQVNTALEDQYSDVLKKFRYGRKMGLRSLSEMTGISVDDLRNAEAGTYLPSDKEWALLGQALGFEGSVMKELHFSPERTPHPILPPSVLPVEESYFGYAVWTYLVLHPHDPKRGLLIDTGGIGHRLLDVLDRQGIALDAILLTHGHSDHAGDLSRLGERLPGVVFLSKSDLPLLDAPLPSSLRVREPQEVTDQLHREGWTIDVYPANGHTDGSVAYQTGGVLFVGDGIFCGSCGKPRTPDHFSDSLGTVARLLNSLPAETILVSGHGPFTTVVQERRWNPFYSATLQTESRQK
ncbi:MBL fold metallo-hydrolase [Leptospirillum ferriphilum]|uniref:Metallo-beta-lactamase domain-containing protein n=1 Tax=Leptospirillum ferriphilum TaxID=178606 RepID=A0A1V3SUC7_9BACT|nr:MBL fold metallo-hydrolase [Leptospirillum ferriphilum]OOH71906.1 hypothetical protein BOX24_07495 [Leptospirillum ferriphilum]